MKMLLPDNATLRMREGNFEGRAFIALTVRTPTASCYDCWWEGSPEYTSLKTFAESANAFIEKGVKP